MQIINRLKKLENMAFEGSTTCTCFPQGNFEIYKADLSRGSDSGEPALIGSPLPTVCPECRKPVEN